MGRSLLKSWDNRQNARRGAKHYKTWDRRVRWYEGNDDFRLSFEDTDGVVNVVYKKKEEADKDWDAFKQGKTVAQLRLEHHQV